MSVTPKRGAPLVAPLIYADRLFPADFATRAVARRLYAEVQNLPIVSPHGHTDPRWYADDAPFPDPARLFVTPDHYIFRMLYSQGVTLEEMGIPRRDGGEVETDARKIWRKFAERYYLFRGTPTRLWLDQAFAELFGMTVRLSAETADDYFDRISECLAKPEFRPRALFERFKIEVIATTESPLDPLAAHDAIKASGLEGPRRHRLPPRSGGRSRVRWLQHQPRGVRRPDALRYASHGRAIWRRTACAALYFKERGATSTDHGHPSAQTVDLAQADAERLFAKIVAGEFTEGDAELFRAQMLTEMARMSLDDGLVMQIHPGSMRNHNPAIYEQFGRDMGADIPTRTDYVHALKPLLDRFGNERDLTLILFTLDETAYSRELAPLAGHYPALRLGPAWWFYDSPEGMRRFRELTTETAGFYNTVGFNDDTRAFCSIPARHDVARRVDCAFLADLVVKHLLDEDEAREVARDLAYGSGEESLQALTDRSKTQTQREDMMNRREFLATSALGVLALGGTGIPALAQAKMALKASDVHPDRLSDRRRRSRTSARSSGTRPAAATPCRCSPRCSSAARRKRSSRLRSAPSSSLAFPSARSAR